jgi:VWFA-related protein
MAVTGVPARASSVVGLALAGLAAALGAAVVDARQPAGAAPTATVEFFVAAADGSPIADLRADEIAVRVDGRARTVRSLRWIGTSTGAGAPVFNPALPAPFGTNVIDDEGRSIVVVLDEHSFRPGREGPIRDAFGRYLVELAPRDRVAVVTVPYGGLKADFTTDRDAVTAAIARAAGTLPPSQSGSEFACNTRRTLDAMVGLLDSLGGGRGPTTVLFVSSGLAPPRRDAPMTLAPGACELTIEDFERVGTAATTARAHFYLLQPEEDASLNAIRGVEITDGFSGSDNPRAGLEHLGGVTGGVRLPLLTARDTNLLRIARETSGHYLLEFTPEGADGNGQRHSMDVRVTRAGAIVRSRPSLVIPRSGNRAPRPPAPRDMLRQPRVYRDLPLRVVAYPSRGEGRQVKVVALIDLPGAGTPLRDAAVGLFDSGGKLVAQWTASREELAAPPVVSALLAAPGTYRVRAAAVDTQNRAGTADYTVSTALTPVGPLTVSGLMLGLNRADGFRPVLQFSREPTATGYLELYGPEADSLARVMMELATSENGPPLLTLPATVSTTSERDRAVAMTSFPIGGLPAGDFVVRAIVTVAGQPSGRVLRTLRKVVD